MDEKNVKKEEAMEEILEDLEKEHPPVTPEKEDAKEKRNKDTSSENEASEEVTEEKTSEKNASEEKSEENAEAEDKDRKKKKKEKKDKKDEQIEELSDKVKRQMAEFDNFRKRTEKEKAQMFEVGAKSIIEKILPVIDNFERGLAAVPEDKRDDAFVAGMDKVYKQLQTELENVGVKPIEAVGKEFNPDFHNAVMQVESDEYESGIVAEELQKGYTYHDSVVRHSMVAVVQ